MHKKKVLASLAAATMAAAILAPAGAATLTPFFATGGTAAAFVYYDLANAQLKPNSADTGATCTATTMDCAVEQLYAAVGTGGAQASFLLHAVSGTVGSGEPPFNDAVNLPGVWNPSPTGDIDYAAGDAPLDDAQLTAYNTMPFGTAPSEESVYGPAIVVPTMAIPVGLAYNLTGIATGLPAQGLQLSPATYCGIMTGSITNWQNAAIAGDNPGVTFTNTNINVIVRSDGSGTTFVLSNALNQQCPTFASLTGGVGLGSGTNGAGTVAPIWGTSGAPGWTPIAGATFTQIKGSGGIQAEIASTPGTIGYISTNYEAPFATSCVVGGVTFPCPSAAVLKNKSGKFVAPTVAATLLSLKTILTTAPPASTVNGTTTQYPNPSTNQILYVGNPSNVGAYPIAGFTYGYFYTCSDNKAATAAIEQSKSLFKHYLYKAEVGGALTPADTIISTDNGLVYLSNSIKDKSASLLAGVTTGPVSGVCTI